MPNYVMNLFALDGDDDEEAMRAIGMSDAAITHCAGDSIVVDVLMDIFNEMISKKGIRQ